MAEGDEDEAVATEEAETGAETSGKKGGGLAPILALIAVILLGVGLAYAVQSALAPEAEEEDGEDGQELTLQQQGAIWETQNAIDLGEILANVKGERGRRYVKLELQVWVNMEDFEHVSRAEVMPSLKAIVQNKLRSWEMNDYEHENMAETMEHEFTKVLDKTLRELFGESNIERTYISRVVLNYLVQ